MMVDLETLFTIIYVLVDDWYQTEGKQFLKGKRGCKARFSDSEVMTLLLAMDFIPFPSESQSPKGRRSALFGLHSSQLSPSFS